MYSGGGEKIAKKKGEDKLKAPYVLGILILLFLSLPKGFCTVKYCLYICWDTNPTKINKKFVFSSNVSVSVVLYTEMRILSVSLSSYSERVVFPNMKGVKEFGGVGAIVSMAMRT